MTSLITWLMVLADTYQTPVAGLGLVVLLLLVAVLIQKELWHALGGQPANNRWLRALDLAIAPLTLLFAFIIILRLLIIIQPAG